MKSHVVAAISLLSVLGCAHAKMDGRPDPKTVRVLNSPPVDPYDVVDTVVAKEDDLDEAMDSLREMAADRRGDAVVVTFQTATERRFWKGGKVQLAGEVIRFRRADATPTPTSSP